MRRERRGGRVSRTASLSRRTAGRGEEGAEIRLTTETLSTLRGTLRGRGRREGRGRDALARRGAAPGTASADLEAPLQGPHRASVRRRTVRYLRHRGSCLTAVPPQVRVRAWRSDAGAGSCSCFLPAAVGRASIWQATVSMPTTTDRARRTTPAPTSMRKGAAAPTRSRTRSPRMAFRARAATESSTRARNATGIPRGSAHRTARRAGFARASTAGGRRRADRRRSRATTAMTTATASATTAYGAGSTRPRFRSRSTTCGEARPTTSGPSARRERCCTGTATRGTENVRTLPGSWRRCGGSPPMTCGPSAERARFCTGPPPVGRRSRSRRASRCWMSGASPRRTCYS